jgi:hypothetical protein
MPLYAITPFTQQLMRTSGSCLHMHIFIMMFKAHAKAAAVSLSHHKTVQQPIECRAGPIFCQAAGTLVPMVAWHSLHV